MACWITVSSLTGRRNKTNKITTLAVLACLSASLSASPQDLEVTPEGSDYWNVRVGSSSTVIFTITSVGMMPLSVESITIVDDATGSFSITSAAQAARSPALEKTRLSGHQRSLSSQLSEARHGRPLLQAPADMHRAFLGAQHGDDFARAHVLLRFPLARREMSVPTSASMGYV